MDVARTDTFMASLPMIILTTGGCALSKDGSGIITGLVKNQRDLKMGLRCIYIMTSLVMGPWR